MELSSITEFPAFEVKLSKGFFQFLKNIRQMLILLKIFFKQLEDILDSFDIVKEKNLAFVKKVAKTLFRTFAIGIKITSIEEEDGAQLQIC